jgi:hypothetical protein
MYCYAPYGMLKLTAQTRSMHTQTANSANTQHAHTKHTSSKTHYLQKILSHSCLFLVQMQKHIMHRHITFSTFSHILFCLILFSHSHSQLQGLSNYLTKERTQLDDLIQNLTPPVREVTNANASGSTAHTMKFFLFFFL